MKKFIEESWLVLTMGIAFALLLASTHSGLSQTIKTNEQAALTEAIGEVVPGTAEKEELVVKLDEKDITVFRCTDAEGELVGWAVDHEGTGFIDKIRVVVGLDPQLQEILAIMALAHLETPGLGNKIDSDKGPFAGQFVGAPAGVALELVKRNPGAAEQIEAITGATYSSQYVVDIVNDVTQKIRPLILNEQYETAQE